MQTFKHENQSYPPSLSVYGKLRSSKESDLLPLLAQNDSSSPPDFIDSIMFDGGALVHLLSTTSITTFDQQYADDVFILHILKQLQRCTRVDIVLDTYTTDSIKASTREKRGIGIRQSAREFLRDETNKTELLSFLSKKVSDFDFPGGKEHLAPAYFRMAPIITCNHVITKRQTQECLYT